MRPLGKQNLTIVYPSVENVARQIDVDRTRLSTGRDPEGLVDDLRNATRINYPLGPLGNRLEHPNLIHFLKRAHPRLRDRTGASKGDDRDRIEKCVAYSGNQIRRTRSGGREADSRLPADAAVSMCRHRRGLLVTHIDRSEALDTARGDVDHRSAGQVEDRLHPL